MYRCVTGEYSLVMYLICYSTLSTIVMVLYVKQKSTNWSPASEEIGNMTEAYKIKIHWLTTLDYANWMRAKGKLQNSENNITINNNNSTSAEKLEFIYSKWDLEIAVMLYLQKYMIIDRSSGRQIITGWQSTY